MIPCICFFQDGQIDGARRAALTAQLDAFSRRAFDAPANQTWIAVPPGNGFTEAKPSTSSIVTFQADTALDQPTRIRLLERICDIWMAETGCSLNEIVATVTDPQ